MWKELHNINWDISDTQLATDVSNRLWVWVVHSAAWRWEGCGNNLWGWALWNCWCLSKLYNRLYHDLWWAQLPEYSPWSLLWVHQAWHYQDVIKFGQSALLCRTKPQLQLCWSYVFIPVCWCSHEFLSNHTSSFRATHLSVARTILMSLSHREMLLDGRTHCTVVYYVYFIGHVAQ